MKDIITSILTDASMRDDSAVEAALMQQAVAAPWNDIGV
jgi:hypothetical protein